MNEQTDLTEFDPFENDKTNGKSRRGGGGIAWLALVIALVAAGEGGYRLWQDWQSEPDDAEALRAQREVQAEQARLAGELESLQGRMAELAQAPGQAQVDALEQRLRELDGRLAGTDAELLDAQSQEQALQAALFDQASKTADLEDAVAALTARSDTPGQRLDISEIETLLRMATERLSLNSDPHAADLALALADERLAAMDDPVYLPVRQRIARARQALAALDQPDRIAWESRIDALQSTVARLPFRGEQPPPMEIAPEEETGIWARFKQMLGGLVTVRRQAPEEEDPLSLADEDYLRQGLWLQLESARLALMRADQPVYERSLQRAAETLAGNFEPGAAAVRSAQAEIAALAGLDLQPEWPDISAPWSQLRAIRNRAPAPETTVEPAPDTEAGG